MRVMRVDNFKSLLKQEGDCTVFTGMLDRNGYGIYSNRFAHRIAYELACGPIPSGLTVDHLCFNVRCCKPEHLRLLTNSENAKNQLSARKKHCASGHPYDAANTYRRPTGSRDCRACIRERVRRYTAKKQSPLIAELAKVKP